jgi:hypothetical protein
MSSPDAFGANQTYNAERQVGSIGSFGVTSGPESYTSQNDDSAGVNIPEDREPIYINRCHCILSSLSPLSPHSPLSLLSPLSSLYLLCSNTVFCDNSDDENVDIRPGDDGDDDRMSIASSTMQSVASGMSKDQLEAIVVTMFNKMMQENANANANAVALNPVLQTPQRRTTAAAAGGAAGAEPPPISPARAAFNIEHDRVVAHTETMCQEIQKLNQKELWWVQQWVNEAKLKYTAGTIRTYTDNVHRYNVKRAAGMRVQQRTTA